MPRARTRLGLLALGLGLGLGLVDGVAGCGDESDACIDLLYDCIDGCDGVPNRVACEASCDDAYMSCLGTVELDPPGSPSVDASGATPD